MELEQLKQQWDILHKKLDEQQIINKRLMENAVTQKADFINSYNWFGNIIGLIATPFIILLALEKEIDIEIIIATVGIVTFFIAFGVYNALQFNKIKSLKNNIIFKEKSIIQYEKSSFVYYLISLFVIFGFLCVIMFVYYDRFVANNRVWFFVSFIIVAIFGAVGKMKWYLSKVKKFHQSISDLKE